MRGKTRKRDLHFCKRADISAKERYICANERMSFLGHSHRHAYRHTHCTTLHHTATHCSTLQHTATHCSTLRHTAAHCNTLQHTATHCNTPENSDTFCVDLGCAQKTTRLWEPVSPTWIGLDQMNA